MDDSNSEMPSLLDALPLSPVLEETEAEGQDLMQVDSSIQNPNVSGGGSDSGSDSDSDSDDEAQQNLQLQTLESDLSSNPSNYDAHVQYIKLLRKMGDIKKLRQAREAMSSIFPLTPSMWQEWVKDEASLSTGSEAFHEIEELYERAVSDYLSISLWCDYINFVREFDPSVREFSPAGISKARKLFEHALTAAGLHVVEGHKIWEAYREFEQAIFDTIDKADNEAKEKQVKCIRSIFHRQLFVPLDNLRSKLHEYKAWEVGQGSILDVESSGSDGIPSNVASGYKKALDMYNARVHLEEQISRLDKSDAERLQQFMMYLKFEKSSGDPGRVQILYERAITDFPISSDLWLEYTGYLDKTLKIGNVVKDVYSRATKNCPWVGELWVRYLLSLERGHASEKEISAVYEKSLQCTFSTFEEYMDLFLTRVDGLRRRISFAGEVEDVLDYSLIKETFQRASDYLSPHLKNTYGLLHLYAYWARLELNLGKDLGAARGVLESSLKLCGSMLEAWQGYIAMETELGHINEARSIYKRCYSKRFSGTGSEDVCQSWLRFEREFGTLEDFDHAVHKVTPRLEELRAYKLQQESKLLDQGDNIVKKNTREKRKLGSNIADEQSPAKRQKDNQEKPKPVYAGNKAQVPSEAPDSKVEAGKPESANERLKDSIPEKAKVYTDQCTAFVSNLNLKAKYDDLRDFFKDVGGVVDVRILKDKYTGKSRGLAYVDFSDESHLAKAIGKNKKTFLGKKLSIARSQPKKGKKESAGQSNQQENVHSSDQTGVAGEPDSSASVESSKDMGAPKEPNKGTEIKHRNDNVQLKGKNTFAMPRAVRPLGRPASKPKTDEVGDEQLKSNDEFRKLFLKD